MLSLTEVKARVRFCELCFNVAEAIRCRICLDPRRDVHAICVVEEPKDVVAIERTREFRGRYHVLGGAITHKVWAAESGFLFPVLSDFWPHGAVAQAYGVFNDDAGFSNRGTFVVDRSGIIRFAEMNGPGEPRDQSLWTEAWRP